MKIFLVAISLLFCTGGYCLAESPATQQHDKTKSAQQQTKTEGRNSAPSPIANVTTSRFEKKTDKNEPHWYDELDKNRFLLLIGLLQLGVFGLQARRLRQTIKVTEKAADAAEKSAAALPLIERAHVFTVQGTCTP